jgi:1,4-alpha-glucan branching enzyme
MAEIKLTEVGVHVNGKIATFGIYLPGIRSADGFGVNVRVINRADQFAPEIPSQVSPLTFDPLHPLGLWKVDFDLSKITGVGHFGQDGEYLYRFELWRNGSLLTKHFSDPFAARVGPGFLGSFDVGSVTPFTWSDQNYLTPALDDLIVYELQVEEFNSTLDGIVDRLDYLQGLGVNCLEIMPVNPIKRGFDWGYGPIGYFATEEVFGGNDALKNLVDQCHARGIAVILDVVFGHAAADDFPYARVYDDAAMPNPMMQTPNRDPFGRGFEWTFEFTQLYFAAVTQHFLDEYHVDGFRYDNVPGYYDGPIGSGYAKLAFGTYKYSRSIARFQGPQFSRLIQCAEALDHPQKILQETYSNSTWQDVMLNKVRDMVYWKYVDDDFAHQLDPSFVGYPATKDASDAGDKPFPTAPFQYIETHDHSRFIASFGLDPTDNGELQFGNRDLFFKTQAYAIAMLTGAGVPMLFQGQEFAENYVIPGDGNGRIGIRRGVHWEYFYDESGQPLVKLYRRLGKLRRSLPALRSRQLFYFNAPSHLADGVIIYSRTALAAPGQAQQVAVVAVNFSDTDRTVSISLPQPGVYTELLDGPNLPAPQTFAVAAAGQQITVVVKSNYGIVLVCPAPASI